MIIAIMSKLENGFVQSARVLTTYKGRLVASFTFVS